MATKNENMLKYTESDLNITYIDTVIGEHKLGNWKHQPRNNPYHRIILVFKGDFTAFVGGTPVTVKKDQLLYVPNNVSYQSESLSSEFQYISALFLLEDDDAIDYPFRVLYDLQFPEKFFQVI